MKIRQILSGIAIVLVIACFIAVPVGLCYYGYYASTHPTGTSTIRYSLWKRCRDLLTDFLVWDKETERDVRVYDIRYDANGYPQFLIYDRTTNQWLLKSAKHFWPII